MEAKEGHEEEQEEYNQPAKEAVEDSTSEPLGDPVNVDTPGWKSSQGGQGSGVFGTGGENPTDAEEEEIKSTEGDAPGTEAGVGGEVAPGGGQMQGPAGADGDHGEQEPIQIKVKGATEEDNERYRKLLAYMEALKEEKHLKEEEDKERLEEKRKKQQRWELMRESIRFLKENDHKW